MDVRGNVLAEYASTRVIVATEAGSIHISSASAWTQGYADTSTGAHFVLFDNLWNTNYVF